MNTCPHCGVQARTDWPAEFRCGSRTHSGGDFIRSQSCFRSESTKLRDRIAKLTAAGQRAVDYCDGKHAMLNEVLEGWRKATE